MIPRRSILMGMAVVASSTALARLSPTQSALVVTATAKEIGQFADKTIPVTVQERTPVQYQDNVGRPAEVVFVERDGKFVPIGAIQQATFSRDMVDVTSFDSLYAVVMESIPTAEYVVVSTGPVTMNVKASKR